MRCPMRYPMRYPLMKLCRAKSGKNARETQCVFCVPSQTKRAWPSFPFGVPPSGGNNVARRCRLKPAFRLQRVAALVAVSGYAK
jgi:hypothetical protein